MVEIDMADGLMIEIDAKQATRLRAAAEARGMTLDEYVRATLDAELASGEADMPPIEEEADHAEIERRWALFEETGEAFDHADIATLLRKRAGPGGA